LITGASGLIGQRVLEQWDIEALRAEAVDHARDDLLQPGVPTALVERVRPAVVVHLAWSASGTPSYRTSAANELWLRSTCELARACRDRGAWLIATGTALDKSGIVSDAYSAAKIGLWDELAPAVRAGTMTWLRPYYVVDPERRRPALVENALSARDAGTPVSLRTPDSEHDFIHASDAGRAVVLAARHRLAGEVAIGSGRVRRVCDLVAALGIPWVSQSASSEATQAHLSEAADIGRLTELGWAPMRTEELFAPD
jgi:nucleoside-diphosphate-sugar epimerase